MVYPPYLTPRSFCYQLFSRIYLNSNWRKERQRVIIVESSNIRNQCRSDLLTLVVSGKLPPCIGGQCMWEINSPLPKKPLATSGGTLVEKHLLDHWPETCMQIRSFDFCMTFLDCMLSQVNVLKKNFRYFWFYMVTFVYKVFSDWTRWISGAVKSKSPLPTIRQYFELIEKIESIL